MAAFSKEDVLDKLKTVIDPELHVDIVSLGLIYKITLQDETVRILMTLTTPGCPLAPIINMMVEEALKDLPHFDPKKLIIDLTFDPPWTPGMIEEKTRISLGLDEWG